MQTPHLADADEARIASRVRLRLYGKPTKNDDRGLNHDVFGLQKPSIDSPSTGKMFEKVMSGVTRH